MVIPSTLEVLEERTFNLCEKLTSVVFAEDSRLREIGKECFSITGLKIFEAPPSLRKIDNGAFCFCKNLRRVVLNEGLETVGTDGKESNDKSCVFDHSGIKEIVLPGTLVQLDRDVF